MTLKENSIAQQWLIYSYIGYNDSSTIENNIDIHTLDNTVEILNNFYFNNLRPSSSSSDNKNVFRKLIMHLNDIISELTATS